MQVLVDGTLNSVYSDIATVDIVFAPDAPVIVQGPQDAWVPVGALTTLAVVATSTSGPLTYQWQLNGINIPGATSDTCVPRHVPRAPTHRLSFNFGPHVPCNTCAFPQACCSLVAPAPPSYSRLA